MLGIVSYTHFYSNTVASRLQLNHGRLTYTVKDANFEKLISLKDLIGLSIGNGRNVALSLGGYIGGMSLYKYLSTAFWLVLCFLLQITLFFSKL